MGYTPVDIIREFGAQVERCASAQVRERVMAGADKLTARRRSVTRCAASAA